jgi:hypothetical protein
MRRVVREPCAQLLIEPGYWLIQLTPIVIARGALLEHCTSRGSVSGLIHRQDRKIEAHRFIFHLLAADRLIGAGTRWSSW